MDIGKIINQRRTELNLTLEEVGNAVGVSKSTVKKWEDGYISNMKRDKISQLANVLKLNPVTLVTGEITEPSNVELLSRSEIRMIPVFESVSAGFGAYASNDIVDYMPLYIESDYEADETLCIKVKGDSMYPKIEDGDIIQVHKQDTVDNGQIAVVLIDGEEGLVKKFYCGRNYIELISINPEYPPKRFEKEEMNRISIIGLVRKIIKEC
ncbi:MAG: LexA family protein [Porcipelethomonas sp.]